MSCVEFCATCRYFLANDDVPGEGVCRRWPPAPVPIMMQRQGHPKDAWLVRSTFAPMLASGWCGEWKATEQPRTVHGLVPSSVAHAQRMVVLRARRRPNREKRLAVLDRT